MQTAEYGVLKPMQCGENFPKTLAKLGSDVEDFGRFTCLTQQLLRTPVALIEMAGGTWPGGSALSHCLCQAVTGDNAPLLVSDSRVGAQLPPQVALRDETVIAFLGVPIHRADGGAMGTLCTIDSQPRVWSMSDVLMLQRIADCVAAEVLIRSRSAVSAEAHAALQRRHEALRLYNAQVESVVAAFITPDLAIADRFRALLRVGCQALGMQIGTLNRIDGGHHVVVYAQGPNHDAAEGRRQNVAATACSLAVRGQHQLALADAWRDPRREFRDSAGQSLRSYLGAPIIYNGALYGTLAFTSRLPREGGWSEEQVALMSLMTLTVTTNLSIRAEAHRLHGSALVQAGFLAEHASRHTGQGAMPGTSRMVHNRSD